MSSVPCEQVFSSSKETDTLWQSNLSLALMEILQILKFCMHQEHLSFTDDWLTSDTVLASLDISQEYIDHSMAKGKIDEVLLLIAKAQQVIEAES